MTDASWLKSMTNILDSYSDPAVLIDENYTIVATNQLYQHRFGDQKTTPPIKCYTMSHGYQHPCDKEGETCPMHAARDSNATSSVLHVHNTPQGKEHVGIETTPVTDEQERRYFIEIMRPIREASAEPIANKMIGRSKAFNQLVDLIHKVGPTDVNVLLTGASGTGKELAAQAVHKASRRARKPFVTVECSGLPDSLFESELFGHLRGAFTGATSTRKGLVEAAQGGTLFLDEVGDIPLHQQVKLLRLIETRTYRPVGQTELREADFRLICATHKNLPDMVEQKLFREDLYHRISTFPIRLPALQERCEDLPLLAASILLRIDPTRPLKLSDDALVLLSEQPFSGNIRELKNILERAVVLRDSDELTQQTIAQALNLSPSQAANQTTVFLTAAQQRLSLAEVESHYLDALLSLHDDKAEVAEIAQCSLRTLYRKIKQGD